MSKETVNITLDHFKPKAAPGYGWRNNSEAHMKLHFTVEVLDKDGNEIVNKKFRGYGPYPYKSQIEIDYITDDLQAFMIEEIRSTMNKTLFVRVCKAITKDMIKACNKDEIGYWTGDWGGNRGNLHDKKPIAETPLKEIEIQYYLPKYQKKIIKLILKDKSLFKNKEVGERVTKLDAKAGYNWVESGAITEDDFVEMINKNANRVFAKAEIKFLADKGLDRGSKINAMLVDQASFDIKAFSDNTTILLDITEEDIALFAERLAELPKKSNYEDKYKVEKGKILTYILSTKNWLTENKQLLASKDWELVLKAAYNGDFDKKNEDFPVNNGDAIDYDSSIVDIFAGLWACAYRTITDPSFRFSIYSPMIYNDSPINRRIVEKAMNYRITHRMMSDHYKYIEEMGLVDEFNNPKFEKKTVKNTDPKTEDEKVEFMVSMLSLDYWDNDSEYEVTGEVDTFYKLVEECKSNEDQAKLINRFIFSSFIYYDFPSKHDLDSSKVDILSDLYTSLDFGKKDASGILRLSSHAFIYLYKIGRYLDPLALACWEKLIDRPEAYCEFKEEQDKLKEHAPHLYEKFLSLTPPKPEYYQVFYESGKLQESGTHTCEDKSNVKYYYESGQIKSDLDAGQQWYESGAIESDGGVDFYESGAIKTKKTEYLDKENYSYITCYEDGSIKKKGRVVNNILTVSMYLVTGEKILQITLDRNIHKHIGEYSHWYKSGQLWDVVTYNNSGEKEKRTTYDEQGGVIFTSDYDNDNPCNQSGIEQEIPYGDATHCFIPSIDQSTTWVEGVKHGAETIYEYEGDFTIENLTLLTASSFEYCDGKKGDIKTYETFYKSGSCSFRVGLKDDKREGLETWWYENGQKKAEANYVDDKVEGLIKWWHDDGSKHVETNFKDGKRHGTRILWDKGGNVTFTATYDNGSSNNQNGLDPQYDDEGSLTHYIEYKDGVAVNEKVGKIN